MKKNKQEDDAKKLAKEVLLKEYWALSAKENIPKTPEITKKLDELQNAIKAL